MMDRGVEACKGDGAAAHGIIAQTNGEGWVSSPVRILTGRSSASEDHDESERWCRGTQGLGHQRGKSREGRDEAENSALRLIHLPLKEEWNRQGCNSSPNKACYHSLTAVLPDTLTDTLTFRGGIDRGATVLLIKPATTA